MNKRFANDPAHLCTGMCNRPCALTRVDFGVDLYNIFNVNTPTACQGTCAARTRAGGEWLRPTAIVQPRSRG